MKLKGKRFVEPDEVETMLFEWGRLKWLSEPNVTNAERFSFGIVILDPGTAHPKHVHSDSEEVLYVISGEGEQTIGDERRQIKPGSLIHMPPGIYHQIINTGWEPMRFIVIYAPPGPEAKLRESPDVKLLPPRRGR